MMKVAHGPQTGHPPRSAAHRILFVQILRGLAALAVVVHHANLEFTKSLSTSTDTSPPGSPLDRFRLDSGVDVFFCISGFIMALSIARAGGSDHPGLTFFARRLIRIVPVYWIATSLVLVGAFIAPSASNYGLRDPLIALCSYLFLPVSSEGAVLLPILAPGWTLQYEMFFYVLCALSFFTRRRLLLLSLALALLPLIGLSAEAKPAPIAVWTNAIIVEFALGIAVGAIYLARSAIPSVIVASSLLVGFAGLCIPSDTALVEVLPRFVVTGIPAALIVFGFAFLPDPKPSLVARIAIAVGNSSYSLYLFHLFAIRAIRLIVVKANVHLQLGTFLILCVCASLLLAELVFRTIERPMTRSLNRQLRRWTGARHRPAGTGLDPKQSRLTTE